MSTLSFILLKERQTIYFRFNLTLIKHWNRRVLHRVWYRFINNAFVDQKYSKRAGIIWDL